MGLLYTTEATRRMVDTLNLAFAGPPEIGKPKGLKYIRDRAKPGTKLYNMLDKKNWPAGHLSWSLRLLPFDQGSSTGSIGALTKKDMRRWAFFLKKVLKNKQFDDLKNAVADGILNNDPTKNIVRISVDHVELPDLADANVVAFDAPVTGIIIIIDPFERRPPYVRHITMFTKLLNPTADEDDFDTPVGDDGNPADFDGAPWVTSKIPP